MATMTTLSSRDFQQNASLAQKEAQNGPVFITKRGKPSHVLLSIEQYRRLATKPQSIVELIAMPGIEDVDLESVLIRSRELPGPVDLS